MTQTDIFSITQICKQHQVEISFIHQLRDNGLIEIEEKEKTEYVAADRVNEIERFIRLHYELDINLEGLEAINHLLNKVETMQHEITELHNHLRRYEG